MSRKSLWAVLHLAAIIIIFVSLSSGLRIAILEYPVILRFSYLLPQGDMHTLHVYGAWLLTGLTGIYIWLLCKGVLANLSQFNRKKRNGQYNWFFACLLRVTLPVLIATGWLLYSETQWLTTSLIKQVHFAAALIMLLYTLFHTLGYFIQLGITFIKLTIKPIFTLSKQLQMVSLGVLLLLFISGYIWFQNHSHPLLLADIKPDIYIHIDGELSEPAWQTTKPITINTHGGANFENGTTDITVRAMQNGQDAYFYFRWQDRTQSLAHLPLIKTQHGWQVKQNGFQNFDELTYYEDKFAVILSENCDLNAAGTAHLGPKPLADKPKHWSGKGYHYTKQGLVDLWQWKAVRTNSMYLMDDNYIAQPATHSAADRRYTAGYQQDGKESGNYKMNWQWYYQDKITPKRLPINDEFLVPYQAPDLLSSFGNNSDNNSATSSQPWVIPWFDSAPYKKENDHYPIGTIMPSVLYSSNRFEGDRADVRAFAKWRNGFWSLEVFRKLNTQSDKDITIQDGICIWLAAFDHSQIAHTRHTRPIKLVF